MAAPMSKVRSDAREYYVAAVISRRRFSESLGDILQGGPLRLAIRIRFGRGVEQTRPFLLHFNKIVFVFLGSFFDRRHYSCIRMRLFMAAPHM